MQAKKKQKRVVRSSRERISKRGKFFFALYIMHTYAHTHVFIVVREREDRRKDEAVDAVAAEMFGSEVVEFA